VESQKGICGFPEIPEIIMDDVEQDNVVYPELQITFWALSNHGVLANHISLKFSCGIPERIMWTNYITLCGCFGDVVGPHKGHRRDLIHIYYRLAET
jgi:hypothetical protein